ncbi:energy transducer TonB [Winogradskyella echinorum]|uniref:Energy transducer TonB n=1 Tax=Winogradskyella echinorum TaxID=538189 RepID=A0ABR6Y4A9_9FLAO|nr:energy transducer TonB [Winogradskyella echinorum]MBC3847562.1 energy transducer TonB [Winogradskyella echinorum]MBC5751910.1 energy transducer TonB [Winogradskyella echinorum]
MRYLETKHERNSARITALIALILLLLLFVVGPQYLDPPEEYGIAVNFGTTDFGSGNKPLSEPRKAVKEEVIEESQPEETKVEPTEATSKAEEVITQESAESIAIKKQKAAEAKAKAEAERAERLKREAEEKKRREDEEKRKKLDALIGGVKDAEGKDDGGEGPDDIGGNKGQRDGDPYAPSYFGGSGPGKGGIGYGLGGRGRPSKKIYKQECNEYGLVVVKIEVNRQGKVIKAEPGIRGTTNTHPCLLEPAKKIALSHKWPADNDAPARQVGFVSINFDVGQ